MKSEIRSNIYQSLEGIYQSLGRTVSRTLSVGKPFPRGDISTLKEIPSKFYSDYGRANRKRKMRRKGVR